MEAAYGLAITLCMIATSILFSNYLVIKRTKPIFIYLYLTVFLIIEVSFLFANINKFPHGGYGSVNRRWVVIPGDVYVVQSEKDQEQVY